MSLGNKITIKSKPVSAANIYIFFLFSSRLLLRLFRTFYRKKKQKTRSSVTAFPLGFWFSTLNLQGENRPPASFTASNGTWLFGTQTATLAAAFFFFLFFADSAWMIQRFTSRSQMSQQPLLAPGCVDGEGFGGETDFSLIKRCFCFQF